MTRSFKRAAIVAVAVLMFGGGVLAQTPDAQESPFQEVIVDGYRFQVDPFFPCVSFLTRRVEELDTETATRNTVTFQLFVNADGTMVPVKELIVIPENTMTETAEVGQAFPCQPQTAEEPDPGDG